ncbi:hypothetical protein I3F58_04865 [Streptomyces sp. MUM 203J]|uniref:hypothetical protein n=1 Tax=Streptomyces sp. MUM 203J TaxID=2791990 RepID=UPI001F0380AD|nr:hypothetical protein [Streptomyces sp. MUM 203J]MCH0538897.1 hypothetical protein [Streptomyces sp. MUM 203J]
MAVRWVRGVTALALAAVLAAGAAGCADDDGGSPLDRASAAASAAASVGSDVASAAASAASRAPEVLASATAEVGRKFEEITDGVDARDDVALGTPVTDGETGRTLVEVTVQNSTGSERSFIVQVNFHDQDGSLVDVAVVTVRDVAAAATGTATARSTHELPSGVTADTGAALRF